MGIKENRFIRITAQEYRNMCSGNKYHAQKVYDDGKVFDSKFEHSRAKQLELLLRSGRISDLEFQKRFLLQDSFINNQGKKIREICYVADFYYFDRDRNKWVVEDTKSPATRTNVYMIKKKMFEYRYVDILFVEIIKK